MRFIVLVFFCFSLQTHSYGQSSNEKNDSSQIKDSSGVKERPEVTPENKYKTSTLKPSEDELRRIRDVLKNDKLDVEVKAKKLLRKKSRRKAKKIISRSFYYPSESDYWQFASEYWLVKNASTLHWDFRKPEYGVARAFKKLLKKLGFMEREIKILVVNSTRLHHFSLPAGDRSVIFLLSLPFMKLMDLTKMEIATLLLEDFVRVHSGHFLKNIRERGYKKFVGEKIKGKKAKTKFLTKLASEFTDFAFKRGYNFQQQYEVTQEVSKLLFTNKEYWNAYFSLLKKRDALVKSNVAYKSYVKIYPSPTMQLSWINPDSRK